MEHITCGNEKFGIWIFPKALKETDKTINAIEKIANSENNKDCLWSAAQVGHYTTDTSSRRCFDWKPNLQILGLNKEITEETSRVNSMRNTIIDTALEYSNYFKVNLGFIETMNIIKYYDNNYFHYHSDDGYSYVSTISSVAYLNDDFSGGGLHFKHFDIEIQPKAGDIVVFPSNFLYLHSALNVTSGIKYSVVTMFDYNRHEYFKTTYRTNIDSSIEKFNI